MTRFLLDTSAFLRFVLHDVPDQSNAMAEFFRRVKAGEYDVRIPLVVFFEATYALTALYGLSRKEVHACCEKLLRVPYVDIPERAVLREGFMTWVHETTLSFADSVLLHAARLDNRELVTFDKKLARAAKAS